MISVGEGILLKEDVHLKEGMKERMIAGTITEEE